MGFDVFICLRCFANYAAARVHVNVWGGINSAECGNEINAVLCCFLGFECAFWLVYDEVKAPD